MCVCQVYDTYVTYVVHVNMCVFMYIHVCVYIHVHIHEQACVRVAADAEGTLTFQKNGIRVPGVLRNVRGPVVAAVMLAECSVGDAVQVGQACVHLCI
jgi:hypothetical protein